MNRLNGLRGTDEKFRAFGLTADSLGSDDVLVRSKATGASAVYSSDAAQLLFACADFESIAGHASAEIERRRRQLQHGGARSWQDRLFAGVLRLAERSDVYIPVQSGELEPVIRQLREFAEQGFLCSERQLRKRLDRACQSGGGNESPGSITAVGIPTCERPRHLERALMSYVSSLREVSRSTSILVVDDSDDRQSRKENRSITERMNDGYDGSVQYLCRRVREDLIRRMGDETDIPSEVITFALQGSEVHSMTYGAAVNTVLLTTAGEKIFLSDDDMLCRSASSPDRQKGLGLSSRSPYEYRFFKNRTAAVEAVDFVTEDVLGRHEQLLGRSAACAMLSHGIGSSDFDISGLDYSLLTDLEWHDPSIVLTFPGRSARGRR